MLDDLQLLFTLVQKNKIKKKC